MAAGRQSQAVDVEILVHVAAPSRAADDASYRQLAQSYLSFQPRGRVAVSEASARGREGGNPEHAGEEEDSVGRERSSAASSPGKDFAAVTSGQPWVPESQDLSFQSVYDNRSSPPLQERRRSVEGSDESLSTQLASSWRAPPSQISDSYPLPDAGVLRATPTRVLENYLKNQHSSSLPRPSLAGRAPPHVRGSVSPVGHGVENIPSSIPIPPDVDEAARSLPGFGSDADIIPVTPRAPEAVFSRKREEPSPTVIDETIYMPSSAIGAASEAASFRAESAPPPSKRQRGPADEAKAADLQRCSSDAGPARTRRPAGSSSAAPKELSDVLEIRPPSPPAGIADLQPADLISDKLAKLARDLSSRYRPLAANRPTEPFERGYWLLDCTNWTQDTRVEAWVFLANYLRSGLAGWGVWCRRDQSHRWIRLYCWAHVAKHTYLLLYLASARHLKTTGAQWIGADGDVVLEVPPAAKQST
ncbi:hypothetical protein Trco_006433 [Trichoderma cornu-damae]|uniref:Uncharacterized protein n=1 Tax=Trichoderma cornu-damae TaxID=654480 RepID=A0A9P8QGW2_9HYPO|nr:hypothetical protein Trco_006433 [Trichoderma cornu-damae]